MINLKIDPEFQSQIPPLTDDEFKQLEENILKEGKLISPLILWGNTLVDGHNRYAILQKHPEIYFSTMPLPFESREEVLAWICKNQLGRRNLTPEQKNYLIGKAVQSGASKKLRTAETATTTDATASFARNRPGGLVSNRQQFLPPLRTRASQQAERRAEQGHRNPTLPVLRNSCAAWRSCGTDWCPVCSRASCPGRFESAVRPICTASPRMPAMTEPQADRARDSAPGADRPAPQSSYSR